MIFVAFYSDMHKLETFYLLTIKEKSKNCEQNMKSTLTTQG